MSNELSNIGGISIDQNNKHNIMFNAEMVHVTSYINAQKKSAELNNAMNNNSIYSNQKILELSSVGLSISNGDYYILPYGGKPKFELDYKGMLKICSKEAHKKGFQLIVKADTLREGFTKADVTTDGLIDSITVENGKINAKIVSSFAVIALMDLNTHKVIMQKVEIFPIEEYEKVKSSTKSKDRQGNIFGVWKEYESEMAKKAILRRSVKVINTMFFSDTIDKILSFDAENHEILEENKELKKKLNCFIEQDLEDAKIKIDNKEI